MRTSEKPRRPRGAGTRGLVTGVFTLAAGMLLAMGLSAAPAGAAVATSAAHASPGIMRPQTLSTCNIGTNNSYEYYVWCDGSGPTSYRAIAYCTDGEVVLGTERWDGDDRQSYASCESNGLDSTLDENWGILLCSTNSGDGVFQGYLDRHGDISQYLQYWGNGTIATGGTWACDYDTVGTPFVSPTQPEIVSAGLNRA